MLFHPIKEFVDAVNEMPKEFFEVYLYLIEKGVSHPVADAAAREAMQSNFKRKM